MVDLARDALENQAPHDHPEAQATLGVHLVDIRLLQGRAHEAVPLVAAAADAYPHIAAYRGTLALCLLEAGDVAGARVAYRTFAERAFELPPDSNWLLGIVALADTAAVLGEPGEAATLYEQLEPWAGRQVVLNCYGGGGAYWGPVTHHLGLLAARRGDRPAAGDLLHRAVDDSEAFRAPLFATRSRAALAALAYGRPGP